MNSKMKIYMKIKFNKICIYNHKHNLNKVYSKLLKDGRQILILRIKREIYINFKVQIKFSMSKDLLAL